MKPGLTGKPGRGLCAGGDVSAMPARYRGSPLCHGRMGG